jgi:hypothetical protein
LVEFLGGLSLLFGLLSRVAAVATIGEMIGSVLTVHIHFGFFMNWFGDQKGEGLECHLIAIAVALLITVQGAGRYPLTTYCPLGHFGRGRNSSACAGSPLNLDDQGALRGVTKQ